MLSNRAKTTACCIPASVAKTDWKDTFSRLSILLTMLAVFLLTGLKTFSQTAVMLEVNGKPYKAGKAVLFGQPAVNLDQAGNGPYTAVQDPMQWQNGNLNPNQAHYIEHHSIPYRLIMTDMPVGTEVTLTMNFDFVNSKKYALDFLTGYQQLQPHSYINHNTEETVNPLAPAAFSAPTSQMDIPAPSYLNAAALNDFNTLTDVDARKISIWGANFNTGASIVYTPEPNILVLDNVNKKVAWTIKFTPTSSTVTLAWGGHIASRDDWGYNATTGEPNSAGGINGSPYHMRTESWSLGNIGNQDRSLQTALAAPTCPTSLIPSGSSNITYNEGSGHYEICPNLPATFSVGTQPAGTTYQWSVTGDATAQGPTDQPNFTVLSAKHCGSFTVTVQIQNGSGFIAICSVTVYVVDTVKPTIALNGVDQGVDGSKTDFKECDEGFPTLSGLTYSDNCNADIAGTGGVVVSDWVIDNTHTTIDGKCVTQKATKKWTVTDYCGNVNTFTYIVYSVDTKAPFISGLSSSDQVQCNTEPQFVTPQVGDNCDPNPTLTHEDSQVDMGNCVTKFIRTWNAVDWCGNKAEPVSQYFLIRHDNTPPTVDIKATKDLGCNPGSITFDEPSVSDDCGTPTAVDGYPQTGTESIDGCKHSLTKTWKYVDACGNVGTATQTLSWIVDTEAPNVTNGNSFTKDLGCNPPGDINSNFITPTFDGGCSEASVVGPTLVSEVTTGCNQSRTWKWVANDCSGKSTTVTQTLNWIVDHDAPIVTGNGSFEKALGCNPTNVNDNFKTPTFDGGCSAANVSGPVETNTVDGCAHSRTWTWTATDCSGLSTTVTQKLTWTEDHDAPAVTSNNSFEKALGCNPTNINDNFKTPTFDGGCSAANVSGPVETNTVVGCAHTRSWSWTATDCSGIPTMVTQTLTWTEDHDAPSVTSNNSFEKAIGCNPTNINDNFKTPTFDGGCSAANVSGPVETNTVDGCAHTRSWTWTATDCSGLSTTVTQKLTWTEDHDAPAVTSNNSFEKALGCNPTNVNDNFKTPTFDGGCSAANVSGPVETNTVDGCAHTRSWTWTATDCSGLSTTVTQTLTWTEDHDAPSVTSNNSFEKAIGCNPTNINDNFKTPTFDGGCSAANVSGPVETNTVDGCAHSRSWTWTATDCSGLSTTVTQKLTWTEDHDAPAVTSNDSFEKDLGCNPSNINDNFKTPTFDGGCSVANVSGPVESNSVKDCTHSRSWTWTATDCSGIPTTVTQTLSWKEDLVKPVFDNVPADASYDCGTTIPDAPVVTATDNCDGTLTATLVSQTDLIEGDCGVYYFYRNWSVKDACGNTNTAQQKITINPVNPIFVPESLPGDETIECGAGVPPTNPPTATVCTPAGPVEATITGPERSDNVKIDDCSYQYTETWTAIYPGTANCQNPPSAQYTRTVTVVDTQKPTISGLPTETTVTVKCDQDLPPVPEVTATDACDPNPKVVYEQTGPVAMNCVDGIKESYTRTWYAVDACGNKTETFTQTINVMCCEAFCTYTQGYYGNPGGTSCDGTGNTYTTAQLITKSLNTWGGITLGKAGVRSIKVGTGDASYVIDYLPGGGASKKLNPGDCNISDATCIKSYLKNGRFSNTLLAQTLTLMLNVGVKTSLGDLELKSGMYLNTGDLEGGCGSKIIKSCQYDIYGNVTYSPYHSYMLPASVINYLSGIGKANVSGLIELANNLLGGDAAPSGVTLDAVASAEDILNNAFDECKGFAGWSAQPKTCPPPPPSDGVAPSSPMITTQQLSVKAFPNPYNEDITFVINSSVSGRGTLNLFNLKGEQVSTVFDGNVQANKTITLTYKVPPLHRTSLVYHFAIGKKIETGKLIRPN